MGAEQSCSDPSHNYVRQPWRDVDWRDNHRALRSVRDYRLPADRRQLRILLYGPAGAGKSSFINSVQSVVRRRMCVQALVDNTSNHSFTRTFQTHRILKEDQKSFYPFVFTDLMGLEPTRGVLVDDIKLVLRGHVKENYKFSPKSKLSAADRHYNGSPGDDDKVHVLVCVIDANTATLMDDGVLQKIRDIRMEASELEIPQVAILTKVDQSCPSIQSDLKMVYRYTCLKKKMEEFSVNVGIPLNCIFPVQNYHAELDLQDDIDSLILSALRHIIDFGDDYLKWKKSPETVMGPSPSQAVIV